MTFHKFMTQWQDKITAGKTRKGAEAMTLDYTIKMRVQADSPEQAADRATDWLNLGAEPDSITVHCPHCDAEIERGDPPATTLYNCPECGKEVSI